MIQLENQHYFVLTYMTGIDSSYKSTPVYIYPLNDQGQVIGQPLSIGESEHVRSIKKIRTPWGEGILMADHGKDGGGFLGGNLILLVVDKFSHKLIDVSSRLHQPRNFSFNAIPVNRRNKYDDILVSPYNGPHGKVIYLQATDNGYVEANELLPERWRKLQVCFMTASPFDINRNGFDEIALGGCDVEENQNPVAHDQLLEWKNGHWDFSSEDIFPPRKQSPNWGTVYWLNDNERLIALTHNKGYSKGDIQIFSYDKLRKKFQQDQIFLNDQKRAQSSYYFHKIQWFNDSYYGLIRYRQTDFETPNILRLKPTKEGAWKEENVCLATPPGEVILGIDSLHIPGKKAHLILTYYSGRYEIYE